MSALRMPLPRPKKEKPEATNIRLAPALKQRLAEVAVERYGWTMTHLMRRLAEREVSHKRGLIFSKLK